MTAQDGADSTRIDVVLPGYAAIGMRPPRELPALRRLATKYRTRVLVMMILVGALFSSPGIASLLEGRVQPDSILSVVLGVFFILVGIEYIRGDRAPPDFSLAEKTKYYLDRLALLGKQYIEAYSDPQERRLLARKCRRIVGYLWTVLSPFGTAKDERKSTSTTQQAKPADLFVDDLSNFATQVTDLMQLLSTLFIQRQPLPGLLASQFEELARALEDDSSSLGQWHEKALEMAFSAARGLRVESDPALGLTLGQRLAIGMWQAYLNLSPGGKIALWTTVITGLYWSVVGSFPMFRTAMSIEGIILIYLGVLGAFYAAFMAARR